MTMSKRRIRRRDTDSMTLSFLDAISCGFGAIVLLLVITKIFEPIRLEESQTELEGLVAAYEEELNQILGETDRVERERRATTEDLNTDEMQIAALQRELTRIRSELLRRQDDAEFANELEGRLAQAKQSLTEEMRRLIADYRPPIDEYKIGGIPVDSEYIIFLVDNSPSMQQYAWDRVLQQMRETLEAYPTVLGIQVMNDEGTPLFRSYRNEWIPDSPGRREAILEAMRNWNAYSNSNPREGILEAIRIFRDPEKKISLHVYSDDFASGSINAVVREIDRANRPNMAGERPVRIHAVAFPVYYEVLGELFTAANFATLMRVICQRNGGTFVALPSRSRRR